MKTASAFAGFGAGAGGGGGGAGAGAGFGVATAVVGGGATTASGGDGFTGSGGGAGSGVLGSFLATDGGGVRDGRSEAAAGPVSSPLRIFNIMSAPTVRPARQTIRNASVRNVFDFFAGGTTGFTD